MLPPVVMHRISSGGAIALSQWMALCEALATRASCGKSRQGGHGAAALEMMRSGFTSAELDLAEARKR